MNPHKITLPAAIAVLTLSTAPVLTSCATLRPALKPLVTKAADHLKEAVQDLDVEGIAQEHACGVYISKGRESAEAIFKHEWPIFAPVFETHPNPAADLKWCTDYLGALEVKIVSKPMGTNSTAVCGVVAFGLGFESQPIESQAAMCHHELAHILGQKRMGCKDWLVDYAHVSGRLAAEGTAYALSDAALARYNVSEADVYRQAERRAEGFPAAYGLSHTVTSECVGDYFGAIRRALRERAGV